MLRRSQVKHRLPVFLLAAALAATSSATQRAAPNPPDEQAAVAALTRMGVPLQRDTLGRVRWIEAVQGEFDDEAMRHLTGLPLLEWLEISGGITTAQGMANLKACPGLIRLYLHDVNLGDDSMRVLGNIYRLEALSLKSTRITGSTLKYINATGLKVLNLTGNDINDADLALISRFAGLEVLALENTKVTGAGLAKLESMKRLNVLNLTNCRITDSDLEHFLPMTNLRIVHASGCNISSQAIETYKEKLPMLAIFK